MKIAIIGSTGLIPKMIEYAGDLQEKGFEVSLPVFDKDTNDIKYLIGENKKRIIAADEVHLFWDGRSPGTIIDIGITIGLGQPLKIIFLEEKSISDYVKLYAEEFK